MNSSVSNLYNIFSRRLKTTNKHYYIKINFPYSLNLFHTISKQFGSQKLAHKHKPISLIIGLKTCRMSWSYSLSYHWDVFFIIHHNSSLHNHKFTISKYKNMSDRWNVSLQLVCLYGTRCRCVDSIVKDDR